MKEDKQCRPIDMKEFVSSKPLTNIDLGEWFEHTRKMFSIMMDDMDWSSTENSDQFTGHKSYAYHQVLFNFISLSPYTPLYQLTVKVAVDNHTYPLLQDAGHINALVLRVAEAMKDSLSHLAVPGFTLAHVTGEVTET